MLQNAYLLARIGFDTAENGAYKFCKMLLTKVRQRDLQQTTMAMKPVLELYLDDPGLLTDKDDKVSGRSLAGGLERTLGGGGSVVSFLEVGRGTVSFIAVSPTFGGLVLG